MDFKFLKSILFAFSIIVFSSCVTTGKFVRVSENVVPKTVAIYVTGTVEEFIFTVKGKKITVEKEIVPVRVSGAGVFISPNNHVLTCAHLFFLKNITGITVCKDNEDCTSAELLFKEDRYDLALMQSYFPIPTNYARLADPRKLKVGQEVLAVGSPLGFPFSVSHGIISALNRDNMGVYNMTQSDAFMNPGNSGGPLFNLSSEIVGINSRISPPVPAPIFTGLGFSVQSGQVIEFLTRFRKLENAFPKFGKEYWETFFETIGLGE